MSDMVLGPLTMKRLAFIRMLFLQGIEQSQLPEPLNVMSVLTLHDASELFLVLAGEWLGADLPHGQVPFMKYWVYLDPAKLTGGVALSGERGMRRLNDLRNALKHGGAMPSATAVAQAREDVRRFLDDNARTVFGLSLEEIDMAEVVPQAQVRGKMRAATSAERSGDRRESMGLLAEACAAALAREYSFGPFVAKPLSTNEITAILWQPASPRRLQPRGAAHELAAQINTLTQAAREMQEGLQIMALGIDYRQFRRFQMIAPSITRQAGGRVERRYLDESAPTTDELDYARQFVVTVALRMAELELHLAEPSWMSAIETHQDAGRS